MSKQNDSGNEVKVWRVNDYEWWAGTNIESIKVAYKEATGIDPDSDEGFDSPRELTAAEMGSMRYCYNEDGYFSENETRSFREQIDLEISEGQTFPCYFAGTEY